MKIKLDENDIQVLKKIKSREETAKFLNGVNNFTPLLGLFSGSHTEFIFTFSTTDWVGHIKTIGHINRIEACSINDLIQSHLNELDLSENKAEFFQSLAKPYYIACTS